MSIKGNICVSGMKKIKPSIYRMLEAREKKVLIWLKEYKKSLGCKKCGENHPACLEFHHINPKEKKFSLGRAKSHLTIKALKAEIVKCKLLCANCHRKEHWEEKEKEQNAPQKVSKI